jgi:EAL domain-containing protein (putative c-di-GMP-specific phosphodiesterase class I)
MKVVAEGVETKEQVDFLTEVGCDMVQGYYFARPMPVNEFEEKYLKNQEASGNEKS